LNEIDAGYLERALLLAERARGRTSPNPLVGAVIVRGTEVIGEGWHVGPGFDHAEVAAIRDVLRRAGSRDAGAGSEQAAAAARALCAGTTIYVTLEPCCTYGRTPPCTSALIAAGFARVVVGAVDPTPQVNGKGLELLRAAGLDVEVADGALAHRCKRQNDGTRKAVTTGLPFVTYKYAMTLDGRVATDSGDSRWISSAESRALVHQWRAWSDAVVVGAGTATVDDPHLTAREAECSRQPLRVVVDRLLGMRRDSNLAKSAGEGPVLVICGPGVSEERREEVKTWGVEVEVAKVGPDGLLDPFDVGRRLVARGAQSVLLEGGPRLAGAWWTAGLIDKVAAFVCPLALGGTEGRGPLLVPGLEKVAEATTLREVEVCRVGRDVLITGYVGGPV
jgi:diaminohydroxyphosphoribosylaminopyrimidine deaminase/5-amino-6-(5-phosphoribosylamino)uracil reductase